MTYGDRYLAFVDVLGFANLVDRSRTSPMIVTQIYEALSTISTRTQASRSVDLKLEATSFSDSVVLSVPVGVEALLRVFQIIEEFSFELLSRSMLFRGALVRGSVVHDSNLIFGPALVNAYRLETNTSFHPRIMLDMEVFAATRQAGEQYREEFDRYVVVDAYDVPYLNPFARWQTGEPLLQEALAQLIQLQDIIAAGLVAGSRNPSVGEKYKWLGRKLNNFIGARNLGTQISPIPNLV